MEYRSFEVVDTKCSTKMIEYNSKTSPRIREKMVDDISKNYITDATTESQPSTPSRSAERNRKKRLKKKLNNERAKREEVDENLSKAEGSLLYIFASIDDDGGYILYRIDIDHSCHEFNDNHDELLLPLLVFGPNALPISFCTLVHMGHYLYFVGQKNSDVFKIPKKKLKNLTPDENNLGSEYLRTVQPMKGPKKTPLVFVANHNLYVISWGYSIESHEFEKYSPTDKSWKDLNPKPEGHGHLKSHVVLDDIVYFATAYETVLSFNLTEGHWSIVSTAPKYPRTYCDIHPAFDAPVEIVGNMIFGAFKLSSDFNITVAASPHNHCDKSTRDRFMRPTLAPDHEFWTEFARRFEYIPNDKNHGSHHMTTLRTLDSQNVLCFVSYGSNSYSDKPLRNYALLTFYKILGGHRKTSVRVEEEVLEGGDRFCYYSRQVEGENAVKSYFKSEFVHRKLLNIRTTNLRTNGKLITCFSY